MKNIIVFLAVMIVLVFSGCSNEQKSNQSVETTSTTTPVTQKPLIDKENIPEINNEIPISAEDTLKTYLDFLLEKDYDALQNFLHYEFVDMTAEKHIEQLKEKDFKNNIERTDYFISNIVDYNETHKLAKVILKGSTYEGEVSSEELIGLKLINGQWKIDYSLIVSKENIGASNVSDNDYLDITRIEKFTKLNGYQFDIYVTSNLLDKEIIIGWVNESIAELTTDNGVISATIERFTIEPQEEDGGFSLNFVTNEVSEARHIRIKGLYIGNNGLPIPRLDPFELNIELK